MGEKKSRQIRNRWVYVIVGLIVMLMVGQIYAWSVMSQSISASHPAWTAAQLSLTFTLTMVFFCSGNFISGILSRRLKSRLVIWLAALLFLIGFFAASFTRDGLWTLYLGFGVFGGLGAGFAYNTVISTVGLWFPDRHGLASGIMLMGFGLSAFLFGNLFSAVTPADGSMAWCVTFRFLGIAIFAVLAVCGFFIVRPGADWEAPAAAHQEVSEEPAVEMDAKGMVRTRAFWLFYIWIVLGGAVGMMLVSQASGIATEVGPTAGATVIAMAVGMISILNGTGRVVFGALYDRMHFRFTLSFDIAAFFLMELILILAFGIGSFPLAIFGFMVGGFAYGGLSPIASAFPGDFFGHRYYAVNFSIIMTNGMFSSIFSTVSGRLYDVSSSYHSTIFLMLGISLVGLVLFLCIRRPKAAEA